MNKRPRPTEEELFYLERKGFMWQGMTATRYHITSDWMFQKDNKTYNLEVANLSWIDAIESKGLFIISGALKP